MCGPFRISAMLAGIETEHPHVFGPMGFRLDDDGDAVACFFPGQRALGWGIFVILTKYLIDVDDARSWETPKKKPGHKDRANRKKTKRSRRGDRSRPV